ncbi:MAG: diguanylate cyclase [Thermoguttaceae bacterium]|nr:diguanylate cyclase [Thermoguttaceae bacterium]
MPVIVIDILFALISAGLGAAATWWLINGRRGAVEERRRAQEVLARLHEVAVRVAADVGEHHTKVEEINEELNAVEGREADAVLGAVSRIIAANEHMQKQLATADERLREQARAIESHATEARTDSLTLLPNRRAFDDEMARLLREFQQEGRDFSVAMVDIDHFKRVNDNIGHQAGDAVLRGVAETLNRSVGDKGTVTRYGGEEFAVIMPNRSLAEAEAEAERLRLAVADAEFKHEKASVKVTVSVGVTQTISGDDRTRIIERADSALYASKNADRNCSHRHNGRAVEAVRIAPVAPSPAPSPPAPGPQPGGLASLSQFRMELSRRLDAWRRGGGRPMVVLVKIDHHERLSTEFGTQAARFASHATQRLLQAAVRPTDPIAHFADATFIMMLPGVGMKMGIALVERLRQAIGQCMVPLSGQHLRFAVSIGVAEAERGEPVESLIRRTENALDAAIQPGGNRTYVHNGQWAETAEAALEKCRPTEPATA